MRSVLSMVVFGSLIASVGCLGMEELTGEDNASLGKRHQASPQLNLSHIECTEGGVLAHFVLLFNGKDTPGPISGTYNGGSFGPTAPGKNTGNVWHYNVILPAGEIEILSATVTAASGETVSLHNPSEYSGNYDCGPEQPVCEVVVEPAEEYCTDKPLGNPGAECAHFGLVAVGGKDDGLSGTTFEASMDAYVALVKSGTGNCGPGNASYSVYVNVSAGDILSSSGQDISHVTYCACPE